MRSFAPLLALALALTLSGCGRVSPTITSAAPLTDMKVLKANALDDGMGLGAHMPQPQAPVVTAPVVTTGPQFDALLVISDVKKTTSGILLWKKLTVTGKVTNRGEQPLSGEVTLKFMKSGKVVENGRKPIASLAPGQTMTFELKSSASADDVQTVTKAL